MMYTTVRSASALRSPPRGTSYDRVGGSYERSPTPQFTAPLRAVSNSQRQDATQPSMKNESAVHVTRKQREVHYAPPIGQHQQQYSSSSSNAHGQPQDDDVPYHLSVMEAKLDRLLMNSSHHAAPPMFPATTSYVAAAPMPQPVYYAQPQTVVMPPPVVVQQPPEPQLYYAPSHQSVSSSLVYNDHSVYPYHTPVHSYNGAARGYPPPTSVLDPLLVASELYGTRIVSPQRHRALPRGAVHVPPPPVLPTYPSARDEIEEMERGYAWLALRNMLRDVEDREIKDRLRLVEQQLIAAGTLQERMEELRAMQKESITQERLAAMDAEAMFRRHYANVASGEAHRVVVEEDLVRAHEYREASPDGRESRRLLNVTRNSPDRPAVVRLVTTTTTTTTNNRTQSQPAAGGPSPIQSTPYVPTPMSYRPTSALAQHEVSSMSTNRSVLPPAPTSPNKTRHNTSGSSAMNTSVDSTASRPQRYSAIAKELGLDPITQREVQHAEHVMTQAEYQAARRRYKKALMEKTLSSAV